MIDWLAIKKAAALPMMSPAAIGSAGRPYTTLDYNPDMTAATLGTLGSQNGKSVPKRPYTASWNPVANAGANYVRRDGRPGSAHVVKLPGGGFTHYAWSQPTGGGRFATSLRRGYIRPLLYGRQAAAREQQETADAYEARWRRLFELAPDQRARDNLERRRRMGQIPPVVLRGSYDGKAGQVDLDDFWFGNPDEVIQATVEPGQGRSVSYPDGRRIYLGPSDLDALRLWREEWAHQAALTPKPKGRRSVLDRVLGGDDYQKLVDAGQKAFGAYELDPAELTRMVLLQKAAAARTGAPRFTNVKEWSDFIRNPEHPVQNGMPQPGADMMDNPYIPGTTRFDYSTEGRQVLDILDKLQYGMENASDPKMKEAYREQYIQLYNALQDAIDMAAVTRANGTMTA